MFSAKPIRRLFLFFVTVLVSASLSSPSVYAAAGTLNLTGSTASFSSSLTQGSNIPIRTAYGPLRFDFKSGPNSYQTGMLMREGDGSVLIGSDLYAASSYTTSPSRLTVIGVVESKNPSGGFKFPDGTTQTTAATAAAASGWTDGGTNVYTTTLTDIVGIGTTSPNKELTLYGSTPQLNLQTTQNTIQGYVGITSGTAQFAINRDIVGNFSNTGAASAAINLNAASNDGKITIFTSPTSNTTPIERVRIDKDGKVGIGTTAPNNLLEVLSTTSPQARTAYSTSQYATTGVSSVGTVTMDSVGTTPGYYFPDRIGVGPNGTLNTNYDAYISNTNMVIDNASANAALAIDATVAGTQTTAGSNHYGIYRNLSFNGSAAAYSVPMIGDINYLVNSVTTIGGNSSFTNHYNWLRNDAAVNFSTNWSNNYNEFKNSSTGTMTSVINDYSNFVNASTGIITSAYGNYTTGSNSAAGTITNLYGLYADSPVNGTGTITSAYGVFVKDQSVGTNTSAYGVYIADQAGAATNNYGIYSAGTTNNNYFGGNVGIGKAVPTDILHIEKDQDGQTTAFISNASAGTSASTFVRVSNANNANDNDNVALAVLGTGLTTSGGFVQDGAVLVAEPNLSGGLSIMTRANAPIRFYTNGFTDANERMRITEAGKVGIGTTAPEEKLHVGAGNIMIDNNQYIKTKKPGGTVVNMIGMDNSGLGVLNIQIGEAGGKILAHDGLTQRIGIDNNGNVSFATLTGSGNRVVYSDPSGNLTNSSSDIRLKKNIVAISSEIDVLASLDRLRGIYYNWDTSVDAAKNLGSQRELGMIAQEVELVLPELVGTNVTGYKSLDYSKMTGFLIEVTKAQQNEIDQLKIDNDELKARLSRVEMMLDK